MTRRSRFPLDPALFRMVPYNPDCLPSMRLAAVCFLTCFLTVASFSLLGPTNVRTRQHPHPAAARPVSVQLQMMNLFGGGSTAARLPTSANDRNNQAIEAVKTAISRPKNRDFPLIECEFPPLASLNKLGDGSMQSANQVDEANVAFSSKLAQAVGGFMGPKVWFVTSLTASTNLMDKVRRKKGSALLHSFRDGLPDVSASDVCIVLTPCVQRDYESAKELARLCKAVVLVNGIAKDTKSVPGGSTAAYYLKPLTYNSQVAGYLLRSYPSDWVTIDAATKKVIGSFKDNQILVRGTNTPDLREPGRLVQKTVDERAIQARRK